MKSDALPNPELVPPHHFPQTQSLELMTHPAVTDACAQAAGGLSDAWEQFFARALAFGERVKQRRANQSLALCPQDSETPDEAAQTRQADKPCA